jgi:NADPH-dependent 2,4-dienoyl-CoA reductase/sulfur reductase-like enzyme
MTQIIETQLLIIGGSDAGISAALRARELDATVRITMILADEYPNLSICGIPYAVSGEVAQWQNLAHRTVDDLRGYDIEFFMNTVATGIDAQSHLVTAKAVDGDEITFRYDKLMVGTGAVPKSVGMKDLPAGVHVLHTMGDFFSIQDDLAKVEQPEVAIVGAGYVGIEMAEALIKRDMAVTLYQRGVEVLSTLDADLAAGIGDELRRHGVTVKTNTAIDVIARAADHYEVVLDDGRVDGDFDVVLVVVGVAPNSTLLAAAGAKVDELGAVVVTDRMETTLPDVYAAGDLVQTKHRLLGDDGYLPLGTTAHKQGRVAGANIVGRETHFAGVIGSQVLRVFEQVAARTGLLASEAEAVGYSVVEHTAVVDDHKAYYPGATKITIRVVADVESHRILGAQLVGAYGSEVAKRADIFATAIYNGMTVEAFSDLDLTYSPVVGAPWDAVQAAVQQLELKLNQN